MRMLFCLALLAVPSAEAATRVVLVTLDGVRREELMTEGVMPFFFRDLVPRGRLLGLPDTTPSVLVGNPQLVSLPAYQSILAGRTQPCSSNDCGRIQRDGTLPERLVSDEGFAKEDVAIFASWERVALATERIPGTSLTNAGIVPLPFRDPVLDRIAEAQAADRPPWGAARWDRYTTAMALAYWDRAAPRFFYVALNDPDEWAHAGRMEEHLQSLRAADAFLQVLVARIAAREASDGGRTCLLVTTDHGRGVGERWTHHGQGDPYAAWIWMYGSCDPAGRGSPPPDGAKAARRSVYSHLDVRPTLEAWLGLAPTRGPFRGAKVPELD